jgi:hypothetical protein
MIRNPMPKGVRWGGLRKSERRCGHGHRLKRILSMIPHSRCGFDLNLR